MDFESELKLGFLEEAAQSISDVEECFLDLEKDPSNVETINKIFRLAHNLKGSSKAVGFNEFGAFTHEFETFILKIKNGQFNCTPDVVNILLAANDHVKVMIEGLKSDLNAQFDSTQLLDQMKNFNPGTGAQLASAPAEPIESVRVEPSIEEILAQQAAQEAMLSNQVLEKANKTNAVATPKAAADETLRVALTKVEHLLNNVGEMVILQSVLQQQMQSVQNEELKKIVHQISKISKEIQDSSMSLRMTAIKPVFQKMQRIVRDTALALHKDFQLVLTGEETEIDKTVLDRIGDPLVHLIRNSVDHGIESSEVRLANGKPAQGKVELSAFHKSGSLVIEIKDDGGGLNPEKLRKIAIQKGVIKADAQLTEQECQQLIFAPGFSTKEQVTDVSGRGVGMDVVKTNITELNGEIKIESKVGTGTTFRIILPLTMAIIDSLIVTYSEQKFAIPLNHVHETLKPKATHIQTNKNLGETLILRNENLPIFRLGDFFGFRSHIPTSELICLVIRTSKEPFCILVDDILYQSQVVTKQLGQEIQGVKGISGTTILGDGKPALIIEPNDLIKRKISPGFTPKKEENAKVA